MRKEIFIVFLLLLNICCTEKEDDFEYEFIKNNNYIEFQFEASSKEMTAEVSLIANTVTIDWGDGTVKKYINDHINESGAPSFISHTYNDNKEYRIRVSTEQLKAFYFSGDRFYMNEKGILIRYFKNLELKNCPQLKSLHILNSGKNVPLDFTRCLQLEEAYLSQAPFDNLNNCINLRILRCNNCNLRTLDISKNIKLEFLDYSDNRVQEIDISKNNKLTNINCGYNNMDSYNLNNLFSQLPNNSGKIDYKGNPGIDDCDPFILITKGWKSSK